MRRYLPFTIIAFVALVTMGVATTLYRSKMHAAAQPSAMATPAASAVPEKEDESVHARGPRTAPVTMEIYGDFQCPSCGMASAMVDDLLKEYGDQVRLVFHEFPLAMHKHAMTAAMAAEAAGLQGHFWEMHDMLYQYQPVWSRASDVSGFFGAYAQSLGLDTGKFEMDAKSPEVRERVVSEGAEGTARGVKNTPTFFINGREVLGGFRPENLKAAINAALAEKKKS
jgi:protein-disulfide isomerase